MNRHFEILTPSPSSVIRPTHPAPAGVRAWLFFAHTSEIFPGEHNDNSSMVGRMIGQLANSIRQHLGIPVTRTLSTVRYLREAGMFPSGGPGRGPEFTRADVVTLIVAVAAGAKLDDVAAATKATLAAVPGGANLAGAPLTVPRTAEVALAVLANQAADGDDLDELIIEISHGEPEVAFVWSDGVTQRFQVPGALANHVPRGRVATRIPGAALASIIRKFK